LPASRGSGVFGHRTVTPPDAAYKYPRYSATRPANLAKIHDSLLLKRRVGVLQVSHVPHYHTIDVEVSSTRPHPWHKKTPVRVNHR